MAYKASRRFEVLALLVFVALALTIAFSLFKDAGGVINFGTPYRVTVTLPDAFALEGAADVDAAGVKVGAVVGIKPAPRPEGAAAVQIQFNSNFRPIYRDAQVQLRTKTLVGEDYISITQGSPSSGAVPNGGLLGLNNAISSVQLDQIFNSLDPNTRRGISASLRGLGYAVNGRAEDLQQTLTDLSALTNSGGQVASILASESGDVAALLQEGSHVLDAISARDSALRLLATDARTAAEAAASRDDALRATIRALPSTLLSVQSASAALGDLGRNGASVLAGLRGAVRALTPTVRDLGPSAADGVQVLGRFPELAGKLNPLVSTLGSFSADSAGTFPQLDQALTQLQPLAQFMAPYSSDIAAFFANLGAAAASQDATGHLINVGLVADAQTLLDSQSPALQSLLKALNAAGLIGSSAGATKTDSYPKPGSNGAPQPFSGAYPSVAGPPRASSGR
jgi:phospholipid/cholesterol/gamma-HCH transport system substrate-binding protein